MKQQLCLSKGGMPQLDPASKKNFQAVHPVSGGGKG